MITQEIFNTVYLGLAAQDFRQSYDDDTDQCAYRGPNNLKCAIGHLIPDDKYHPEMDGSIWLARNFHAARMLTELSRDEFSLLQNAHDYANTPADMRERFESIAKTYNLKVPA
ncbi:hypothetical protein [Mesorhizobium sp. WSM2239]|uniref:HNH endonuclease n=2 Tax=unclassified Mesorhizobium TaxID=325217 RepID=A0AAU8DED6_9HYPH